MIFLAISFSLKSLLVLFYTTLHMKSCCLPILIITITISSTVIGALAALFFTNHSLTLKSDIVIGQLAVIGHL